MMPGERGGDAELDIETKSPIRGERKGKASMLGEHTTASYQELDCTQGKEGHASENVEGGEEG